jgi:hypothetical protein
MFAQESKVYMSIKFIEIREVCDFVATDSISMSARVVTCLHLITRLVYSDLQKSAEICRNNAEFFCFCFEGRELLIGTSTDVSKCRLIKKSLSRYL